MFQNCKNKSAQGLIGLTEAISFFVKRGNIVSIPLTDNQEYDLVVEVDGFLQKIQVKTSGFKSCSGAYTVDLRTRGGSSDSVNSIVTDSDVDLLFILLQDNTKYLIPIIDIHDLKSGITLGNKYAKYIV